ncbi:MAG TPA: ABC transporter permease [Gemmatimonadaceae bacterium]|nr:ABC transporter permease [Gemmatimonadaceae bacterium]
MSLFESIRLAIAQIRAQKLKSFFTLLGVTLGVMFLIAVVSIVQGMGNYMEDAFAGKFLGVNTFTVRRFPDFNMGDVTEAEWRSWQRRPYITVADGDAIRAVIPDSTQWSLLDMDWTTPQSRYVNGGPQVLTEAASPSFFAIKNLTVTEGRAFTELEDQLGSPVVVIGTDVADHYFPNLDPIGKELRIEGLPFRVIGLLEKQGSAFGLSLDRQMIAPFHSPMSRFIGHHDRVYGVMVKAQNPAAMTDLQGTVSELMRRRHKLRPEQPNDFVLESSASALTQWEVIKGILVKAGVVLPAIGLVVGAIVIMNIMLVAVAERTREIGIRKSLGARRRDILSQFLVEAATLSTAGAALGIGLGFGLSRAIAALSPLPTSVALWSVIVSVVLGAGVGIAAGLYPASRASRLDPIAALRAE